MAFKRISEYTPEELEAGIQGGIEECQKANLDFYTILKAVDSYFEKRTRKLHKEAIQNGTQAHRVSGSGAGTLGNTKNNVG